MDSIIIRLCFTIIGVRIINGCGPVQLVSLKIKIPFPSLEPWYILWQLENFKDEKPHKKNSYNSNLGIIGTTETKGLTAALELQEQMALTHSKLRLAIGGFTIFSYWSSTESGSNDAWLQDFGNGYQYYFFVKYGNNNVRAVRAF